MAGKVLFTIIACSLSVAVFAQVDNSKEDKNVRRTIPIKMLGEQAVIDQRDVKHWANGQNQHQQAGRLQELAVDTVHLGKMNL